MERGIKWDATSLAPYPLSLAPHLVVCQQRLGDRIVIVIAVKDVQGRVVCVVLQVTQKVAQSHFHFVAIVVFANLEVSLANG